MAAPSSNAGAPSASDTAASSAGARRPTSPAGLVPDHALVGADRGRGTIDAMAAAGLATTPRDYAFRSDSHLAQLAAVRAGVGIGVCQLPLSQAPVPLVRVLPQLSFHLDAWVVMHEDLRAVSRIRLVFDHLVAHLAAYAGRSEIAGPGAPSGGGEGKREAG
jgi:DNA-binding transcriptional LysR family regulator